MAFRKMLVQTSSRCFKPELGQSHGSRWLLDWERYDYNNNKATSTRRGTLMGDEHGVSNWWVGHDLD